MFTIGEIFSNDDTLESVASEWLRRFKTHESNAITEIVNLVLRCTGCEIEVAPTDIEDPDNCTNRLKDIQDEFQAVSYVELGLTIIVLTLFRMRLAITPSIAKRESPLSLSAV